MVGPRQGNRWVIAASGAALLLLAGCVESGADGPSSTRSSPVGTLHQSGGQGSLAGSVTDDEARPLEGARVAGQHRDLANQSFEVVTDASGRFVLTGLHEGVWLVQATRLGYFAAAPRAIEVGGEPLEIRFLLKPMPVHEPHHATKTHTIHWNFDFGVILPVVGYVDVSGTSWEGANVTEPYEIDEETSGELMAIIVEAVWTPAFTYFSGAFRTDMYSPEQQGLDARFPPLNYPHWTDTNPYHWDNMPERARSPTYLFIPRLGDNVTAMHSAERTSLNDGDTIETSGRWRLEVQSDGEYARPAFGTPVDIAGTLDQTVTIHTTFFFVGEAKEGWSFLPPK